MLVTHSFVVSNLADPTTFLNRWRRAAPLQFPSLVSEASEAPTTASYQGLNQQLLSIRQSHYRYALLSWQPAKRSHRGEGAEVRNATKSLVFDTSLTSRESPLSRVTPPMT
jgi:hypothetical protein